MLRILLTLWAIASIVAAVYVAGAFLVSFAPSEGRVGELGTAELAGLERGRRFWWAPTLVLTGMTIANAAGILVFAWRRR